MSAGFSREPKRILLIRLKGIGDVLLSTPLLRALRKKFPSSEIHFLTRSFCAPILKNNPYVNQVMVHPEKNASPLEILRLVNGLRAAHYDWVLDLAAEPRSAWLTLGTGAPLRAGYAFHWRKWAFNRKIPKNKVRKYQGEINLDIIRALGVPDDGIQTELFLEPSEIQWAQGALAGLEKKGKPKWKIGLNPTGAWSAKQWPVERWRQLITSLNESLGIIPFLFWGPGSEGLVEQISKGLEDRLMITPDTTLRQFAACITQLDLMIGTDGTPQHMAQALGIPTLSLFGPSWGNGWTLPGNARFRYLQHFLDCGPCERTLCPFPELPPGSALPSKGSPHYHRECMDRITPEKVLGVARELLDLRK